MVLGVKAQAEFFEEFHELETRLLNVYLGTNKMPFAQHLNKVIQLLQGHVFARLLVGSNKRK